MHLEPSTVIEIHQGYFGDVDKSHSVRAFSSVDNDLKTKIKINSDRPFTDDLDGKWAPFTWGKPIDDYYLIMRTFSDLKSDRGGMVFTHALAIPIQDMVRITDIRVVFDLLVSDIDISREKLSPIRINIEQHGEIPSSELLRPAIARLIEGKPSIVPNQYGFEDLVGAIWWNLPPNFRSDFSFGVCMQQDDLVEHPFDIVSIPEQAMNRWGKEMILQVPTELDTPSSTEAMLLGLDDRMVNLLNRLEVQPVSFLQLRKLENIEELYAKLSILSFDQLHALINRINKEAPDSAKGGEIKKEITLLLIAKIASGSVSDLKKLRSLKLEGFGVSYHKIGQAIQDLVSKSLEALKDGGQKDLVDLFVLALENPTSWWSQKLWAAFELWIGAAKDLEFIWKFILQEPKDADSFFHYIPTTKSTEDNLFSSIPNQVLNTACGPLIKISAQRKWVCLHAKLVASTMPLKDAILAQRKVDTNPQNYSGFVIIAAMAKPLEFVELTQIIQEDRLIGFAADLCVKNQSLFNSLDFSKERGQQIFHKSITSYPSDSSIVTMPRVFAVLDQLIQGESVLAELLESFTQRGKGNLLDYPNRVHIWNHLPFEERKLFLSQTAKAWLHFATIRTSQISTPEPELKSELEEGNAARMFISAIYSASFAVGIFRTLPRLPQSLLVEVLRNPQLIGSSFDAKLLGHLVKDYNWREAASTIFQQQKWKLWLQPSVEIIHSLLSIGERITNTFLPVSSRISEEEFWKELVATATELYPKGPDKLIGRLDWDESELSNSDSRREQWEKAVKLTRKRKKEYAVIPLLDKMLIDYPFDGKLNEFKSFAIEKHL